MYDIFGGVVGTIEAVSRPRRAGVPFFLSLVLAGVLLFLAFHGVDWEALRATIRHSRPGILAPAFLVLTLSFFLRAVRWWVLLRTKAALPLRAVFWATAAGYLGNSFLPARAGEVIRSALIARRAAISIGFVLATALIERITDVVALVLIGLIAPLFMHGVPGWLLGAVRGMALVGLVGMASLLVIPRVKRRLGTALRRLPLPTALHDRTGMLLEQFSLGLLTLQQPGALFKFAVLTPVIWLNDGLFAMAVAWALHLSLTFPQAMLLLVGLGLSSAAPSTPGYVGIYQFVAVQVLMPLSFSRSQALGYIITYQGMIYVGVTVLGLVGLWQLQSIQAAGDGTRPLQRRLWHRRISPTQRR